MALNHLPESWLIWARLVKQLSFKIFLALVAILFSAAALLGNFSRGHYEEHFCEIILNIGQW